MATEVTTGLYSTATELSEKFDALFPRWTSIVATMLALAILLLILTKLFYKPVQNMIQERRKFIQENINQSVDQNVQASLNREKANQELLDAKVIATEIISNANIKAEKLRDINLAKAKDDANNIVIQAHKEAEREQELFAIKSKKEIVDIALGAAKKVIEKEVDNKSNRKIIKDFIDEGTLSGSQ